MTENPNVYIVVTDSDHPGRYADRVFTDLDRAEHRRFEIENTPSEENAWIVRRELRGDSLGQDNRPVPSDLIPTKQDVNNPKKNR